MECIKQDMKKVKGLRSAAVGRTHSRQDSLVATLRLRSSLADDELGDSLLEQYSTRQKLS